MSDVSPLPETIRPGHFPPDCPPSDASETSHDVFYLVESSPPNAADFRSALERGVFAGQPECQRAALSCGLEKDYLSALRKGIPRLRRFMISRAKLGPEHDRIKQTGNPGHYSLWLFANALLLAPTLFEVLE